MRYLLLVGILLLSLTCAAAIYMEKDAKGNISYSDVPALDATRIEVSPAATTTFSPAPAAVVPKSKKTNTSKTETDATAVNQEGHADYSAFFISSPTEQQTFQNQRDVPVDISISPSLQKGDSIQLYVDGNKMGEPAVTTHFQVNQLPRGTHQISATLLDANKGVLKQSATVNFFVHYAALGGS